MRRMTLLLLLGLILISSVAWAENEGRYRLFNGKFNYTLGKSEAKGEEMFLIDTFTGQTFRHSFIDNTEKWIPIDATSVNISK